MTPAELDAILDAHRGEVEGALAAIQLDVLGGALTLEVVLSSAEERQVPRAELFIAQLAKRGLLLMFVEALRARGVSIEGDEDLDLPADRVESEPFRRLIKRAEAARCRVLVDHQVAGSGCLVGPSLVLTAWHVIADGSPTQPPRDPLPEVEVQLADETKHAARLPPAFASMCGDAEFTGTAPRLDSDVAERKDVALLRLDTPAARHLDYAPLPATPPKPYTPSQVFLFDFPRGANKGFGIGGTRKMAGVTVRWRHSIRTDPGSSGGAAFGDTFDLLGIHQARWGERGRLVPAWVFLDDIRTAVDEDRAPSSVWTLDPGTDRQLVLGRDAFFLGIRASGRETTRIRGVRVKRRNLQTGHPGLGFSHALLVQLLSRLGPSHRVVRVAFERRVEDLDAEIRARLMEQGFDVPPASDAGGVAVGQAAMEAVLKDRSRVLASAIDSVAHDRGEVVWLFIDAETITMSDSAHLFLEGFLAAALVRHRIRIVIAGFEERLLAGESFFGPADADGEGGPGFLVEFVGGFTASDVRNLLTDASRDLLGEPDDSVEAFADQAVVGLTPFNGVYADADLQTVLDRLQLSIATLRAKAANP